MRKLVLCIDDSSSMLKIRKAALEAYGYSVEIATSGLSALRILEEQTVTAVLLEFKSEGLDAEAIALHVRQRFPQVPIVLLSAYSDMPERILWLVDEYVMKSTTTKNLSAVIQRVAIEPRGAKPSKRAA